jgi:hypothetical protein
MSDHAALLKKARERLVEDRRDLAKTIAAPFEREKTRDAREKFVGAGGFELRNPEMLPAKL